MMSELCNGEYWQVEVEPVSYVRRTQHTKFWDKRSRKYYDFKRFMLFQAKMDKFCPSERLHICFQLAMPKSWSKKKRREMDFMPHQQKPDLDNLCKSVMDVFFENDSVVHEIHATKIWANKGMIAIKNLKGGKG